MSVARLLFAALTTESASTRSSVTAPRVTLTPLAAPVRRKIPPTATDAESSIAATITAMSAARVRSPESAPTVRRVAAGVATARDAKGPASVKAVWAIRGSGCSRGGAEGDARVYGEVPGEFGEG